MSVTTFQGVVKQGQVRLVEDVELPENAHVYIVVLDGPQNVSTNKPDLAEMASRLPSEYHAREEHFGEPVGKEAW